MFVQDGASITCQFWKTAFDNSNVMNYISLLLLFCSSATRNDVEKPSNCQMTFFFKYQRVTLAPSCNLIELSMIKVING